ncbi:PqqD family protein [Gloeobacter kilaueensis]|nr:PqqD family protein [Gloeobacter kilaueensis]
MSSSEGPAFTIAADVLYRQVGDEAILLHASTGNYYALNETAIYLWEGLCSGQPQAGVERVLAEYEVEPEQLERDLQAMLCELTARGILVPRS